MLRFCVVPCKLLLFRFFLQFLLVLTFFWKKIEDFWEISSYLEYISHGNHKSNLKVMKKLRKAMKRSERISKSAMVIDFYFYYVFCYHFHIFLSPSTLCCSYQVSTFEFPQFQQKRCLWHTQFAKNQNE